MTDLEKRAFAFIKSHTLYDECKNEPFLDCSDFELMAKFAQSETALLSKHILELQTTNGALTDRVNELEKENESLENIKNIYIGDLLKAKEIIREYMRFEPMIGTCSFYSEEYEKTKTKTKKKAEAFINKE